MSLPADLEEFQRDLPNAKGKNDCMQSSKDDRGREAQNPGEIPPKGWIDVARRTWNEVSDANLFLVAGGVTYAILLALFPGLAALISIYGLYSTPPRSRGRSVPSPAFFRLRLSNCCLTKCTSLSVHPMEHLGGARQQGCSSPFGPHRAV